MTIRTFPRKSFLRALGLISLVTFTGCGLKKPESRVTQDDIRLKEGSPIPEILHGEWTLDFAASKAALEEKKQDPRLLESRLEALEEANGSSMIIDSEIWKSISQRGEQTFEAALLSQPGDPDMVIGLDAYRTLVALQISNFDENTMIITSESNPVMQHFIWTR